MGLLQLFYEKGEAQNNAYYSQNDTPNESSFKPLIVHKPMITSYESEMSCAHCSTMTYGNSSIKKSQ